MAQVISSTLFLQLIKNFNNKKLSLKFITFYEKYFHNKFCRLNKIRLKKNYFPLQQKLSRCDKFRTYIEFSIVLDSKPELDSKQITLSSFEKFLKLKHLQFQDQNLSKLRSIYLKMRINKRKISKIYIKSLY